MLIDWQYWQAKQRPRVPIGNRRHTFGALTHETAKEWYSTLNWPNATEFLQKYVNSKDGYTQRVDAGPVQPGSAGMRRQHPIASTSTADL